MKQIEKDLRHKLRKEGYKGKKLEEELKLRLAGSEVSVTNSPTAPPLEVKVKRGRKKK